LRIAKFAIGAHPYPMLLCPSSNETFFDYASPYTDAGFRERIRKAVTSHHPTRLYGLLVCHT